MGGDSFHQELGLEHVELEASIFLENLFEVNENAKSNAKRCIDVSIVCICDCPILFMTASKVVNACVELEKKDGAGLLYCNVR